MDAFWTNAEDHSVMLLWKQLLRIKQQSISYVTVEVRNTIIVPCTHVLNQRQHTLLRSKSMQFRVELQHLCFTYQPFGRSVEMRRKKILNFITT